MRDGMVDAADAAVTSEGGDASDASSPNDAGDAGDAGTQSDAGDAGAQSDAGDAGARSDAGDAGDSGLLAGQLLPTGDTITPTAAPGSTLTKFNPGLAGVPSFLADHATSTVTSPNGKTLLVLTSGYNETNYTPAENQANEGYEVPSESGEWVFVYDISGNGAPIQKQVLTLPNSFAGIAFNPNGTEFYVAGGQDDDIHVFDLAGGSWGETTTTTDAGMVVPAPIALGHTTALGLANAPMAAGLAVTQDGSKLVVANYENDSISIVDLTSKTVASELDLRPGKAVSSPASGVAGGEYPFWVVTKGNNTAYVSSQRDREVDVVTFGAVDGGPLTATVTQRIGVRGQPNKMILNKDQSRLFVANGNSDSVTVIDTTSNTVLESVGVLAPPSVFADSTGLKGANPNGLALSPDEKTLYVTDGATNAVAVVSRDPTQPTGASTSGLIPTGWYPTSVSTSADGSYLYVTNAKSVPGPSCKDILDASWGPVGTLDGGPTEGGGPTPDQHCWNGNQYVWQLETAGLLAVPTPSSTTLASLTQQVAANDHFGAGTATDATMSFLQSHIQHVIYIIKENRTYDQVLGDLGAGNGDPSLTMFPQSVTPNLHALAKQFVNLDAFLDTGETSGVGWNWTTAAHATDEIERNQPINYGKGGFTYDWEGTNRNINVGLASLAARLAANPLTPNDPDLLPGAVDVSAPDSNDAEVAGTGYLWDAVLRSGKTIRNYGAFVDLARYSSRVGPLLLPLDPTPFANGHVQAYVSQAALVPNTDPYYRGFDQAYPDQWRYLEWKREFDQYAANGNLPALEVVRLAHDHTGSYGAAVAGVNTPLLQVADNDYAVGELVAAVAASPYANSTLVFVIEDDAQDGPDHVDAHRSTTYVAGPYVKQGAVVSTPYNTISLVKTIEQVLGLSPLGLYDGLATPMSDVFDTTLSPSFSFQAAPSNFLVVGTSLLPAQTDARLDPATKKDLLAVLKRTHDAAYWEKVMKGQNFAREDALDVARFNRALWHGLMGSAPYPTVGPTAAVGSDPDDEQAPWCGYLPDGRVHT
jgi:YVTN family beta-propeller protein